MTFQNLDHARIIRAVVIIFLAGTISMVLTSCAAMVPWLPEMWSRVNENVNPDTATQEELQSELQTEVSSVLDKNLTAMGTLQFVLQGLLMSAVTFFVTRRTTARAATSAEQVSSYGLAIGLGAAFSYGVLCVMVIGAAALWLRLLFFVALIFAGMFGGQAAAPLVGTFPQQPPPKRPRSLFEPAGQGMLTRPAATPQSVAPAGPRAEVYYNMGVTAAMGGRREEAHQHFTHVVQMQPRNVAAWLQLANLADTPIQAWNYVQQARAIEPNNPQVKEAVSIIWPQVQNSATGTPSAQPPYPGGASDETNIPQIQMPTITPPEPPGAVTPPDDHQPDDQHPV